jgi:S-adenosylmethionine synthetase
VLEVEQSLNSPEAKRAHPAIGRDVKVMGVRRGGRIALTIGCAIVDRFVANVDEYKRVTLAATEVALAAARRVTLSGVTCCCTTSQLTS